MTCSVSFVSNRIESAINNMTSREATQIKREIEYLYCDCQKLREKFIHISYAYFLAQISHSLCFQFFLFVLLAFIGSNSKCSVKNSIL